MSVPCSHPRRGRVTSHPVPGSYVEGPHAATNVCDLPECIAEAVAWVTRMTHGLEAHHIPDGAR